MTKPDTQDYKTLYQEQKIQHRFMLSKISHEIRNPVTLVNSFLQILEDHHPELTEDSCWMKVMDNMDFLKKLLNEFSNFNNSEKITLQPVNLYRLFSSITDSTMPKLSEKGISISACDSQDHSKRTSQKHQASDHDKDTKCESGYRCTSASCLKFLSCQRCNARTKHKANNFRTDILYGCC